MSDTDRPTDELNDLQAQIAQLREQIEALIKAGGTSTSGDAAKVCQMPCCGAVKAVCQHVDDFSGRVREQPLLALLIAAGAGFVLGRATR